MKNNNYREVWDQMPLPERIRLSNYYYPTHKAAYVMIDDTKIRHIIHHEDIRKKLEGSRKS